MSQLQSQTPEFVALEPPHATSRAAAQAQSTSAATPASFQRFEQATLPGPGQRDVAFHQKRQGHALGLRACKDGALEIRGEEGQSDELAAIRRLLFPPSPQPEMET